MPEQPSSSSSLPLPQSKVTGNAKEQRQERSLLPTAKCPVCGSPSCRCGENCQCRDNECPCTEEAFCCLASSIVGSLPPPSLAKTKRAKTSWSLPQLPLTSHGRAKPTTSSTPRATTVTSSPHLPLLRHDDPLAAAATTRPGSHTQDSNRGNNNDNEDDDNHSNEQFVQAEFWIEGMTCSMCAQAIEGAVRALPGVANVAISLTTDTAVIGWHEPRYDETTTRDNNHHHDNDTADLEHGSTDADRKKPAQQQLNKKYASLDTITAAIEAVGYTVEQVRLDTEDSVQYGATPESSSPVTNTTPHTAAGHTNSPSLSAQERWEGLNRRQERKVRQKRQAFLYSLLGTVPILLITMILPHVIPSLTKKLQTTPVTLFQHTLPLETVLLFVLATPVQFVSGWSFYKMAYFGLRFGRAGMDVLVALGTTASYGYALSQGVLTAQFDNHQHDDDHQSDEHQHAVHFFETAVMLISFVLLGKWMQAAAVRRTSAALCQLMSLQAKTAVKITPFKDRQNFDPLKDPYMEETVEIERVREGDLVKVIRGSSIPADGRLVFGEAAVDESMVTGESMPVLKTPGSLVLGGTVCVETSHETYLAAEDDDENEQQHDMASNKPREQSVGAAFIHVTGVGSSTALAQIVQLVQEAQTRSVPIQSYADKIASIFVPFVCITALITYLVWYALCSSQVVPKEWYVDKGEDAATFSLMFGVAVLVISCPCALGLATPTAVVVGTGVGAKLGILLKGGEALEIASKVDSVVFDKTGTLTKGTPVLSCFFKLENPDLVLADSVSMQDYLLWLFASLERTSEHPLAKAVVTYAQRRLDYEFLKSRPFLQPKDFKALTGRGASAVVDGARVCVGNRAYARMLGMTIGPVIEECMVQLEDEGMTAVLGAVDGMICVVMGISDELKADAKDSVAFLRNELKTDVWLVTGDNSRTANAIGEKLGIPANRILSEALPAAKVDQVQRLQAEGRVVAMVGDGVNDSPALAQANVGISLGTGAAIAAEASDMVLVKGDVKDVCTALHLSRSIFRRIQWNFVWSMLYNCLGIPIATGIFYPLVHSRLPPTVAALAMALSSISVVLSSLALRLYRPPCVTENCQQQTRQRQQRHNQRDRSRSRSESRSSRYTRRSRSSRRRRQRSVSIWDMFIRRRNSERAYSDDFDLNTHLLAGSGSEMDQTDSTNCIDNRTSARLEESRC